jgi:hypothetical protein
METYKRYPNIIQKAGQTLTTTRYNGPTNSPNLNTPTLGGSTTTTPTKTGRNKNHHQQDAISRHTSPETERLHQLSWFSELSKASLRQLAA